MKRLLTGLATTLFLIETVSVQAGTYEAMCGETKCTVNINGRQINTPLGTIPAKRVTQWGLTGKSKKNKYRCLDHCSFWSYWTSRLYRKTQRL